MRHRSHGAACVLLRCFGKSAVGVPIVLGKPNGEDDTPTGVYYLKNLQQNVSLRGPIDPATNEPKWDSPVDYWMPFVGTWWASTMLHDRTVFVLATPRPIKPTEATDASTCRLIGGVSFRHHPDWRCRHCALVAFRSIAYSRAVRLMFATARSLVLNSSLSCNERASAQTCGTRFRLASCRMGHCFRVRPAAT